MKKADSVLSFMIAIIFGCCLSFGCDKTMAVDCKSWDEDTFNFVEKKCGIHRKEALRLGDEVVPAKFGGKIYYAIGDYLESRIAGRGALLDYLSKHIESFKDVIVFESYGRDRASIVVAVKGKEAFSFSYINGVLKVKEPTHENLFYYPLDKDERECFAEYESLPQILFIFSRYDAGSKAMETYQVSMF